MSREIPTRLTLLNLFDDEEMGGPSATETWGAAYEIAFQAMRLSKRHALASGILEVCPRVPPQIAN